MVAFYNENIEARYRIEDAVLFYKYPDSSRTIIHSELSYRYLCIGSWKCDNTHNAANALTFTIFSRTYSIHF